MTIFNRSIIRRTVSTTLIAGVLAVSTGCATMAHRTEPGQSANACDRRGEVCPWLVGDAALLLLGVIPGVIAFAIDFANGEWKHEPPARQAVLVNESQ